MIDCATPPLKVTVLALPVNVPVDVKAAPTTLKLCEPASTVFDGIDCEIAEGRRSSAREGVRSIGSIIDVEDRGKTRALIERSGVGVVALDRDVRARIVT